MMKVRSIGTTMAGLLSFGVALAATNVLSGPFRISAAELDELVARTENGLAASRLPMGSGGPVVVAAHRETSGEVELHEQFHDVMVGQSGRATLLVGGKTEAQRQTAPGEWLGGTISDAESYELGPGDVVWIPAGLPHKMIVPEGGSIVYLAFKYSK
jgi:mannose-6-phosphate isomerase-like protein (cupin superfamily)